MLHFYVELSGPGHEKIDFQPISPLEKGSVGHPT